MSEQISHAETAERIVERHYTRCLADEVRDALVDAIAAAIAAAEQRGREVPKGHCLTDDGVLRKVLGDFWLTKDGAIIGKGEAWTIWKSIYAEDDEPWKVSTCRLGSDMEGPDPIICVDGCEDERCCVDSVWSTKELAEAALAAQEPKP